MNSNRNRAGRKVRLSRSRWRRSLVSFSGTPTPGPHFEDRDFLIGANIAALHQAALLELPQFFAVRPVPLAV
jgi:hypothetical protein